MHADRSLIPPPRPAPDPLREHFGDADTAAHELPALLDALAGAGAEGPGLPTAPTARALRRRLLERAGRSARHQRGMVNVRRADIAAEHPAPGVRVEPLYRAPSDRPLRPGEPIASELLVLEPGARLPLPASAGPADRAEAWLVLDGRVGIDDCVLCAEDFLHIDGGNAAVLTAGAEGARLLRRVAPASATRQALSPAPARRLQRGGAEAPWVDFGPGIQRRVLHAEAGGAAAMLYRTAPGAAVPHHGHGHDEECFMVDGELFLDDRLLRRGEYQLAPAGTEHHSVFTDTGTVLYAHGDLELDLRVG